MPVQRLRLSDYADPDMESSGSFFTSVKFISAEHCHDFYELCLITEGKVLHYVNGRQETLHAGSLLFIRPDDRHYFEGVGEQFFQFVNLAVSPRAVDDLFRYLGEGFRPGRFLDASGPVRVEVPKAQLDPLKAQLEQMVAVPTNGRSAFRSELRTVLLELMTRHFPLRLWESKTPVPVWLEWVYKEMQKRENFTGGIATMQQLACKSPEHLSREFKKHFRQTPTDFINEVRLHYAKNLLTYGDGKVIDIAYSSGFQNLSHFCHEFKKKYALSPSAYRKANQRLIGSVPNPDEDVLWQR